MEAGQRIRVSLVNHDAYGKGWMIVIELSEPTELDDNREYCCLESYATSGRRRIGSFRWRHLKLYWPLVDLKDSP